MNTFTAPFYALFSIVFYRNVLRSKLSRTFLYLGYLAFLGAVIVCMSMSLRLKPRVESFVDWFKTEMPPMVWTANGLDVQAQQMPYTMFHPEMGGVIIFDTTKETINPADMGNALVFVTAKHLYLNRGQQNQVSVYNLTAPAQNQNAEQLGTVRITPELVDRAYDSLRPWAYVISFIVFIPFFFAWKVLAALFYSLIGLIVNQFRQSKLNYEGIFKVTVYALTPVTLFQFLQLLSPQVEKIPFGLFGSILFTGLYIFFFIKNTDEETILQSK